MQTMKMTQYHWFDRRPLSFKRMQSNQKVVFQQDVTEGGKHSATAKPEILFFRPPFFTAPLVEPVLE